MDNDSKFRHSKRRNIANRFDGENDHKGSFSLKIPDSRKEDYKRIKLNVHEVYDEEE